MQLPLACRPEGYYRECEPGIDFPCWFVDSLKQLDSNLHLVWQEFETLTENPLNEYEGSLDDPRFCINEKFGQLQFGFTPVNRFGDPLPHNSWHIWWLREPFGWFHVMPVSYISDEYLKRLLDRLWFQTRWMDTKKARDYMRDLLELEEREVLKAHIKKSKEFMDLTRENKTLIRKARENLDRGIINPTNPKKDVIMSYKGQGNRSKLIVPVSEREGGLYTGE